ncbi:MinD/ParA family protein [Blastococcus sp. Marseille-P5729]|uniref:MinD/ParA family ATP-binding protein n=1 Tax=Blastococcus sp. Marseille-P5729 TaxID=2086582 RepID=UPI00131B8B8F|nr:MinD/ParA family protein [Blastococcus sp. Marseille-P5729]
MSDPPRQTPGPVDDPVHRRAERSRGSQWAEAAEPLRSSGTSGTTPGGRRGEPAPPPALATDRPPAARARAFYEPGRPGAPAADADRLRPVAPHLDPRIAGLDAVEPPARRRGLRRLRSRGPVTPPNPAAPALDQPVPSPRRIAFVALKGGVGKTTLALLAALTTARARQDPVLLLDTDRTYGSLMLRVGLTPIASIADIAAMGDPGSFHVMQGAVSRTPGGLWVLPSGRSPEQSSALDASSYMAAVRSVYRYFPVMFTDCGAGLTGDLMHRVLTASHAVVIASTPTLDGVLAAMNALHWLDVSGLDGLRQRAVVAMTNVSDEPVISIERTRERLEQMGAGLVTLPHDRALLAGGPVDLDALREPTRRAAYELAAFALQASLQG